MLYRYDRMPCILYLQKIDEERKSQEVPMGDFNFGGNVNDDSKQTAQLASVGVGRGGDGNSGDGSVWVF